MLARSVRVATVVAIHPRASPVVAVPHALGAAAARPFAAAAAATPSQRPAASPASPAAYTLLEYDYAAANMEELAAKRAPLRAAHLAHAATAAGAGRLVLGGAFARPPMGAALVFGPAVSLADVEAFARADPYVTGGLVSAWRARPWAVVLEAPLR